MSVTVHQVTNVSSESMNGQVTALTDRRWYHFIIGQTGVANGCVINTLSGLQLQIASGWGVILGALFTVTSEIITVQASTSGTVNGRLLLQIDTATSTASFVSQAGENLPVLVQEDINANGTIYQLPLATYKVSELAVSYLSNVAPQITGVYALISALTAQVDSKANAITGAASSVATNNLTANRVLISDTSGKIGVSNTNLTQLGYLDATSSIQNQLNGKVPTSRTVNGHALTGNVSVTKSDVGLGNVSNVAQMPLAGGTFTGLAYAQSVNGNQTRLRNIVVQNSSGTAQSTNYIIMRRK